MFENRGACGRWLTAAAFITLTAFAPACSLDSLTGGGGNTFADSPVPAAGAPDTLDIATWNVEWFGNTSKGPSDEALQTDNVGDVLRGADVDIWGLEEIVSEDQLAEAVATAPGYAVLNARDPLVIDGTSFYHASEQKVALVYNTDVVQIRAARIILSEFNHAFAGRPPLEVELTATVGGASIDLVVIVLHAKAFGDQASWQRRHDGAVALQAYLDSQRADDHVLVIGDYNDNVEGSTTRGMPSPYDGFVQAAERYDALTLALTRAGIPTTSHGSAAIDHQIASDELAAYYVPDSVMVHRLDDFIADYDDTTSDHYPVITRFALGGGGGAQVLINEILANEPGSDVGAEFVELVNTGAAPVDLSGWTLSDGVSARHEFADGTTLAAGGAVVVFGSETAIPEGIDGVGASTRALGLNNGGDTVTLRDRNAQVIDELGYTTALSGTDGVSMNRERDGDAQAGFALHQSLSEQPSSPGTRVDGAAW